MKILVRKQDNLIVGKGIAAKLVENGILLDDCVYGLAVDETGKFVEQIPDIIDVEDVPIDFAPFKYFYENDVFVVNANYSIPKTQEQITEDQGKEIEQLKNLVADLTEVVLMGV